MDRQELMNLIKHLKWSRVYSALRCENGDCPITAAFRIKFGRYIPTWNFGMAARMLGLSDTDRDTIVSQADSLRKKVPELES